jgi:ABC-type molybdate transport system substrate-binding protein
LPYPATKYEIAEYPIAAIGKTENKAATAFVRFVAGKTGQRILKQYGFLP